MNTMSTKDSIICRNI